MNTFSSSFHNHVAQTSPFPLAIEIERSEGIYIFDTNGKMYMDMVSGIAVSNIGHRHPHVIEAIKKQLDLHLHVMAYGEFVQKPQSALAKKLSSLLPKQLDNIFLLDSPLRLMIHVYFHDKIP